MKPVVALAALASFLISACAPQPEYKGGAFDPTLSGPERPETTSHPEYAEPPPKRPGLRAPTPGPSPSELVPQEEEKPGPEMMLPRNAVPTYHI